MQLKSVKTQLNNSSARFAFASSMIWGCATIARTYFVIVASRNVRARSVLYVKRNSSLVQRLAYLRICWNRSNLSVKYAKKFSNTTINMNTSTIWCLTSVLSIALISKLVLLIHYWTTWRQVVIQANWFVKLKIVVSIFSKNTLENIHCTQVGNMTASEMPKLSIRGFKKRMKYFKHH